MRKLLSKINLTQKFILVMVICALLPSIIVIIGIVWASNNMINSDGSLNFYYILASLTAIPLIGFFTWFVNKHYLKPIRSITNGLQAVQSNQLESLKPLVTEGFKDEVGDLIKGYNSYLEVAKSNGLRETALKQSEERFGLAIRGANDGIWDWDINKNFCYYSPRWRYMLGYTEESVRNTPSEWFTRVHPDDLDELKADINAHLDGHSHHFENEHRLRHMNGSYIWVVARGLALRDSNGKAFRFAGSIGDISKRKAFEGRLLKDAMHDPLTNLPNQAYFKEVLNHALSRMHRRDDYYAAVLIIDLDRFKTINDSLGYEVGDQVLNEISTRLIRSLRALDTIARYNGDEFSILLEEINGLHDAIRITQRIQKDLVQPIIIENHRISINASIGIVTITRAYQDALEILRDADTAMFQAKANGRGRFEIFDKEIHSHSLSKLRLEDEIQQAIKNEEFQIFFQPVVESGSGEIFYVEALLRWKHPVKGLIGTDTFISLAEESGQISILDKWVLKNACREARVWIDNGFDQLRLSVNISPGMLMNPDLPEIIRSSLADSGISNNMLVIEITESTGIYNSGIAIQNLFELTSLDIEICLDDYGLVASSLEQLKRLPVSTIKVAQSFIKDLPSNINDAAISEAIIKMAHILGMKVVCPGIENINQMNFVKEKGCDYFQGYLFAKPMNQAEFISLLTAEGTGFTRFFNENPEPNQ